MGAPTCASSNKNSLNGYLESVFICVHWWPINNIIAMTQSLSYSKVFGAALCFAAIASTVRAVPSEAGQHYPLVTAPMIAASVGLALVGAILISRSRWWIAFTITMTASITVWALTHFVLKY